MRRRGGLAAGPATEADAVHQPLHVREDLELSRVSERGQLFGDGRLDLGPVGLELIAAEQVMEHRHVTAEQLGGQLEADQGAGGLGEARVLLGQRVQAAQTLGREDEEELEAEGLLEKRQTPISLSTSPADFDAYVMSELKRWEKIIRDNKVKID